jgi:uncharacterized membrane protein
MAKPRARRPHALELSSQTLNGIAFTLTLEVSILTEKKAAKLIELVEELRRDSPHIRDRVDHEAREMATRADPDAIIGAIEQTNQDIKASAKKTK